jgi:uncharacterized membrane protein
MDDEWRARARSAGTDGGRTDTMADTMADTTRLEAFSDGVFAVAITLLVLDIPVPNPKTVPHDGLPGALATLWPHYLAYALSFAAILIMWINHHRMFRLIQRSDHTLLLLNGALLAVIVLVPFSTALLAEYLTGPPSLNQTLNQTLNQKVAAAVFNGVYFVMAIFYNLVWRHAARGLRLLAPDAHQGQTDAITRSYLLGPALYGLAVVLAFINVWASVLLNLALAVYWTLPPLRRVRARPA